MLVARQDHRHRTGRATYRSNRSFALLLSPSESAAAPASPMLLCHSLQREQEGQRCS
jgi:hypothetical protein